MLEACAALLQALLYSGIALAVGGVLARATLQSATATAGVLQRFSRRGAWLTLVATLLALTILIMRLGEIDASIVSAVLMSNVGAAAGLRLSGAVLLLVTPTDDDSFGRGMQLSAAALVLASFLFSGHSAAEGLGPGVLAALHVAVVAWWASSLLAMRSALLRTPDAAADLVRRFSVLAVGAIAALVVAGGVLIAVLIDFSPFEMTAYARNLAIKLSLVTLVFVLAAYNKFALTARVLAKDRSALLKLRKAIDIEILLIAAVLIVTAVMTTYSSPHQN